MSRGPTYLLVRLMRWTSNVCCLIVIASFVIFAVNKTHAASAHQVGELGVVPSHVATHVNGTPPAAPATVKKDTAHRVIDEASATLRSPFAAVASSSHSEWIVELVGTILALFVYGFALRFAARSLGAGLRTI